MNGDFVKWFVAERGRALAMVLLTRRDDLVVKETREENALDLTVCIKTREDARNRSFGVYLEAAMTPVLPDVADKQLKPVLRKVQSIGPFRFPVCVFYFTVKDDQGYYAWAYEPVVTAQGQPGLRAHQRAHCRKLNNESLEEIVAAVQRWYDAFDATVLLHASG